MLTHWGLLLYLCITEVDWGNDCTHTLIEISLSILLRVKSTKVNIGPDNDWHWTGDNGLALNQWWPSLPKLWCITEPQFVNTLRPRQNGLHFPDDILKRIFLNENVWISINISLKFVPMGPINNTPSLVQIMAWRHPGDKPLSKPMTISLLMHIWVNIKL